MTTKTAQKKVKKILPKETAAVAKKAKKGLGTKKIAGILGAVLVPLATVAIGYGLTKYYGINVPTKVMSLVK